MRKPRKHRRVHTHCFKCNANVLLLPALTGHQPPPPWSGRLGISTYGTQFLCKACNLLEIPKQSRPRRGTGSVLANKPAIRRHFGYYYDVLLIREGAVAFPMQKACGPIVQLLYRTELSWARRSLLHPAAPGTSAASRYFLCIYISVSWVWNRMDRPSRGHLRAGLLKKRWDDYFTLHDWIWCMHC